MCNGVDSKMTIIHVHKDYILAGVSHVPFACNYAAWDMQIICIKLWD